MDKLIRITGFLDRDGAFSADPWYSYLGLRPPVAAKPNGEYSVRVLDSGGNKIAGTYFDAVSTARAYTVKGPVPIEGANIPVDVAVRLPEGAARIAVCKGDLEVYSRDVPKTAPEVAFTGLAEGQGLDGKVDLAWDASGADGCELHFEIWYCAHEDKVFKIATDVTGRSREIDLSDCPGAAAGFFRIIATDGVNAAESRSVSISVPFRPPVITSIQKETQRLKATERLFFKADAYDKQDGWLNRTERPERPEHPTQMEHPTLPERPPHPTQMEPTLPERPPHTGRPPHPPHPKHPEHPPRPEPKGSIVWLLAGEEFCFGATLTAEPGSLPPGVHIFTCVATNSYGLSAAKEFSFEILAGEPNAG